MVNCMYHIHHITYKTYESQVELDVEYKRFQSALEFPSVQEPPVDQENIIQEPSDEKSIVQDNRWYYCGEGRKTQERSIAEMLGLETKKIKDEDYDINQRRWVFKGSHSEAEALGIDNKAGINIWEHYYHAVAFRLDRLDDVDDTNVKNNVKHNVKGMFLENITPSKKNILVQICKAIECLRTREDIEINDDEYREEVSHAMPDDY